MLAAGLLAAMALHDSKTASKALLDMAHSLALISPFLMASFAIAGYTKAANVDALIVRVFRGRHALMIILATLFGTMTPLCSISVVSLMAVLLRTGVPLSAVMAFWMGSPVISPDLFVYTWGILGFEVAAARYLTAIFMALFAGFTTLAIEKAGGFRIPLRSHFMHSQATIDDTRKVEWRFWRDSAKRSVFRREFIHAARFLVPWIVLAFLVQSLISQTVPTDWVARWVGVDSDWAIPMAVLLGIPSYVNGIAAVPVVKGFITLGMSKPAAIAFLAAGSVNTVPAIISVLPLVRFRVFLWHLALGIVTAVLAAYGYQAFLSI